MLSPCSCCHRLLSLTTLQSSFILTPIHPSPYPNQLPPAPLPCLFFPWLAREPGLSLSLSLPKRLRVRPPGSVTVSNNPLLCPLVNLAFLLPSTFRGAHLLLPVPLFSRLPHLPRPHCHPLLYIYLLILTLSPLPSPLIGPPNRFSDLLSHDTPLSHLISLLWD